MPRWPCRGLETPAGYTQKNEMLFGVHWWKLRFVRGCLFLREGGRVFLCYKLSIFVNVSWLFATAGKSKELEINGQIRDRESA